jgi:hypothetical protein
MLMPAAKNVRPITESGIFKVSPEREKSHFIITSEPQGISFLDIWFLQCHTKRTVRICFDC